MPTIVTHALLPLIATREMADRQFSQRLIIAGMVAAVLPDVDVVSRLSGIPHTHEFGHRGATHRLLFALLIGRSECCLPKTCAPRAAKRSFLSTSAASHALTDMFTEGGKAIMLFWPLEDDRFKWLFHPVPGFAGRVSRAGK